MEELKFRTNFRKDDIHKYNKAIAEFVAKTGDNRLSIVENKKQSCFSLLDEKNEELGVFWKTFDSIHIITDSDMFDNMQYYMEYCQLNEYITPQDWLAKQK